MTWFYSPMSGQPFGAAARSTVQSGSITSLPRMAIEVGRHRVARLMRGNGLSPKRKQKFKKTTDSQHNKAVASNLLDQNFSRRGTQREMGCRHQLYLDGTGLAVPGRHARPLLPARHRLGRGRSHDRRPAAQGASTDAIGLRQPGTGVIHHSNRGSQGEFNRSSQHSGIGGCYDGTQTAVGSVWTEQVAFARSTGLGTA